MRIVGSVLCGAAVAAIVDLAVAMARGALHGHVASYALAALGLYGVVAIALAAVEAVLVSGLPTPLPRPSAPDVLGTAAAAALFAAVLFVAQRRIVAGFNNPTYAATASALFGLAALVLFLLAQRPLRRLAATPIGNVALLAATLAGLAALAWVLSRVEWRALHMGGVAGMMVLLLAQAVALVWVRARRTWVVAGSLTAVAALGWTAFRLPAEVAASADAGLALGPLIGVARALCDRDRDGYAALFAGGDCDDGRRDVNPAARDVPGNGVDENCAGGDARPHVEVARIETSDWPRVDNLLLVTIDALRADRVRPDLMPRLAGLADRGVRFSHVWAQAPNTPRSFPSALTSRYPSEVAWAEKFKNYSPILDESETVFEALGRAGIRNIGLFSHFYFAPERNLGQGFSEWDNAGAGTIAESNTDIAAPRIAARVTERLRRLAAAPQRFALWTHFFEPHSRYMDHSEFPVTLRGIPGLVARYDGEVRFVDRQLGALLDVLRDTGLERNTAVVVFSDHGEAFGEHRLYGTPVFFHGQALNEEQLRVALVIAAPGLAARTIDAPAMLLDLGPTLCELLGAPTPAAFRGRSLLPAARGSPQAARPAFAEVLPAPSWPHTARALVDGSRKIIDRVSDGIVEVYDLSADPSEKHDLATANPQAGRDARAAVVRFVESELDGS